MVLEHFLDAATKDADWTYSTAASLAVRSLLSVCRVNFTDKESIVVSGNQR